MKKKIVIGVFFLFAILALQGVTVNAKPTAVVVSGVKFHASVKQDAWFTWEILVVDSGRQDFTWEPYHSWTFEALNDTVLTQGDLINVTWTTNPNESVVQGLAGPLDYTGIEVKVGSKTLDQSEPESFFNFLTSPVYVNNSPTPFLEAGLLTLERYGFNTFQMKNVVIHGNNTAGNVTEEFVYPMAWQQAYAHFASKNASVDVVGDDGYFGDIIYGSFLSDLWYDWYYPNYPYDYPDYNAGEHWVFDIAWDAVTGLVQWLRYPSHGPPGTTWRPFHPDYAVQTSLPAPIADHNYDLTYGLDALYIVFDDSSYGNMSQIYAESTWGSDRPAPPGPEPPVTVTETETETQTKTVTNQVTDIITSTVTKAPGFVAFATLAIIGVLVIDIRRRRK
ncbi:MAG: hypothetical protein ACXAC8_09555 [Candidatus Hodarchaeales archaeon]